MNSHSLAIGMNLFIVFAESKSVVHLSCEGSMKCIDAVARAASFLNDRNIYNKSNSENDIIHIVAGERVTNEEEALALAEKKPALRNISTSRQLGLALGRSNVLMVTQSQKKPPRKLSYQSSSVESRSNGDQIEAKTPISSSEDIVSEIKHSNQAVAEDSSRKSGLASEKTLKSDCVNNDSDSESSAGLGHLLCRESLVGLTTETPISMVPVSKGNSSSDGSSSDSSSIIPVKIESIAAKVARYHGSLSVLKSDVPATPPPKKRDSIASKVALEHLRNTFPNLLKPTPPDKPALSTELSSASIHPTRNLTSISTQGTGEQNKSSSDSSSSSLSTVVSSQSCSESDGEIEKNPNYIFAAVEDISIADVQNGHKKDDSSFKILSNGSTTKSEAFVTAPMTTNVEEEVKKTGSILTEFSTGFYDDLETCAEAAEIKKLEEKTQAEKKIAQLLNHKQDLEAKLEAHASDKIQSDNQISKLKAKIKSMEVSASREKIRFESTLSDLTKKLEKIEIEKKATESTSKQFDMVAAHAKVEFNDFKQKILKLEEEINTLTASNQMFQSRSDEFESSRIKSKQHYEELEKKYKSTLRDLEQANSEGLIQRQRGDGFKIELNNVREAGKNAVATAQTEAQTEISALRKEILLYEEKISNAEIDISFVRKENAKLYEEISEKTVELLNIQAAQLDARTKNEKLDEELNRKSAELSALQEEIFELKQKNMECNAQLEKNIHEISALQRDIANVKRKISEVSKENMELKQRDEEFSSLHLKNSAACADELKGQVLALQLSSPKSKSKSIIRSSFDMQLLNKSSEKDNLIASMRGELKATLIDADSARQETASVRSQLDATKQQYISLQQQVRILEALLEKTEKAEASLLHFILREDKTRSNFVPSNTAQPPHDAETVFTVSTHSPNLKLPQKSIDRDAHIAQKESPKKDVPAVDKVSKMSIMPSNTVIKPVEEILCTELTNANKISVQVPKFNVKAAKKVEIEDTSFSSLAKMATETPKTDMTTAKVLNKKNTDANKMPLEVPEVAGTEDTSLSSKDKKVTEVPKTSLKSGRTKLKNTHDDTRPGIIQNAVKPVIVSTNVANTEAAPMKFLPSLKETRVPTSKSKLMKVTPFLPANMTNDDDNNQLTNRVVDANAAKAKNKEKATTVAKVTLNEADATSNFIADERKLSSAARNSTVLPMNFTLSAEENERLKKKRKAEKEEKRARKEKKRQRKIQLFQNSESTNTQSKESGL